MGDTQVGGNLSVHWLVRADDVDPNDETTLMSSERMTAEKREWIQCGADHHRSGNSGKDFTVRIKLPRDADAFLAAVTKAVGEAKAKGRLEFDLEIEKSPTPRTQIQIAWGSIPWSDDLARMQPAARPKGKY